MHRSLAGLPPGIAAGIARLLPCALRRYAQRSGSIKQRLHGHFDRSIDGESQRHTQIDRLQIRSSLSTQAFTAPSRSETRQLDLGIVIGFSSASLGASTTAVSMTFFPDDAVDIKVDRVLTEGRYQLAKPALDTLSSRGEGCP